MYWSYRLVVTTWAQFHERGGELAALAVERLAAADKGLILLGTLRSDGWPRISPVESFEYAGELCLGMMWRSTKALDLLRDPRCVLHTVTARADGTEGDVKVSGFACAVRDAGWRAGYCTALRAATGWAPDGDEWHLFTIDVTAVGGVRVVDGAMLTWTWRPGDAPPAGRPRPRT